MVAATSSTSASCVSGKAKGRNAGRVANWRTGCKIVNWDSEPADGDQVVRVEELELFEYQGQGPRDRHNGAGQRRGQGDAAEVEAAAGEQPPDLGRPDAERLWVGGVEPKGPILSVQGLTGDQVPTFHRDRATSVPHKAIRLFARRP